MDTKDWISALGLAVQYPVLIVAACLIAGGAWWFGWWLRGHLAKSEIAALNSTIGTMNERLELAREKLADVQSELDSTRKKLESAMKKVADQEREITGLRPRAAETVAVDRLARSNTAIRDDLSSLASSTTTLNNDLMLVVRALSKPSATRRSDQARP
jgi:chromosome segregation ATPase